MTRFELGDLRFTVLDGGGLWLDGGAMFGVVPRVLWEKERPPDPVNRIQLALNVLLVEDGRRRILVDTGVGTKWDEKGKGMYAVRTRAADEMLAPVGLKPSDVDLVVLSHLHFDHAGGSTLRDEQGRVVPAFPSATYVVQSGELDFARHAGERTRASYSADDYEPLVSGGRLRLVEGRVDLGGGLSVTPAPGHTPNMQLCEVATGEGRVAFLADLVPLTSHVRIPWVMAYDVEPLVTVETKRRLLPEAAREGWRLVFEHDPYLAVGTLVETRGRLTARPLDRNGSRPAAEE